MFTLLLITTLYALPPAKNNGSFEGVASNVSQITIGAFNNNDACQKEAVRITGRYPVIDGISVRVQTFATCVKTKE